MVKAPIISVTGLVNRFGSNTVHDGLAIDVEEGEILGVVGGSGTGKSVLLKSIIGLNTPQAGNVSIFGIDQADLDSEALSRERCRLGVLFQDGALFSSLTVAQNIQVPMREHLDLSQDLMDELAALKLALVGLGPEVGARMPSDLSGGMRKRAALARALALDPEILFLDEPTAGLDPISASAFDRLIVDLKSALGLTVFLVTHDLDTLAATCDRIAVLAEGRVLVTGKMREMQAFPHPWVQAYFCGARARAAMGGS